MAARGDFPPEGARFVRVGGREIREAQRGRRYYVRFRCHFVAADGSGFWRYSPFRKVVGRKREAEEVASAYRRELEAALGMRGVTTTVGVFADEYQRMREDEAGRGDSRLSPLTVERDALEVRRVKRYFGDVELRRLTAGLCVDGCERMRADGLSANTVNKCMRVLSQVCDYAIGELCRDDASLVLVNPCTHKVVRRAARAPKPKESEALTVEEAVHLARVVREAPRLTGYYVCVYLALATGLRRGEALGLVWGDADLDAAVLHVRKQWAKDGPRNGRRDPKTDESVADVPVDSGTVAFLRRWRDEQGRAMALKGAAQGADTPVCSNTRGFGFIQPDNFSRWRRKFYVEQGLGEWEDPARRRGYHGKNLHTLRHTQATLLVHEGTDPKAVQDRLRHATPSMTFRYTHGVGEKDREAAETMGRLLGGE